MTPAASHTRRMRFPVQSRPGSRPNETPRRLSIYRPLNRLLAVLNRAVQVKLASHDPAGQDWLNVSMRRLLPQIRLNAPCRSQRRLRAFSALLALPLLVCSPSRLVAASFTATLDRETVTVGESATLSLKFEGGEPKQIPSPPPIANLHVESGGSSRNISIVQGQYSSSISQTFTLTPTQPGDYTIPSLQAQIGGQ